MPQVKRPVAGLWVALALAGLVGTGSVWAQASGAIAPAASASAPAVELADPAIRSVRYHVRHKIEKDGRSLSSYQIAAKVLKQEAIEEAKQHTLSISHSAQTLKVLEAYTLKADGRKLQVPKSSWQVRQNTGAKGNSPIFSDYSSTTLVFPDLAVGDSVVLSYQIGTREPLFPGKVSMEENFPGMMAYDDVRIVVDAPVDMPLKTRVFDMDEKVSSQGARRLHTWTWRNPAPKVNPRRNWSVYDVGTFPGYLLSSFESWEDVARSYVQRATPKAAVTPAIRELAHQIVGDRSAQDLRGRVQALHEWVATQVNYAGNCVGIGAVVPRDLDVVIKHRIGDCKDHATLLQALLAAEGIDSHQVLVNSGSIYRLPEVPVASLVNHVINYIPALEQFVDSTDSLSPLGRLPLTLYGKPVLRAVASQVPERIPVEKVGDSQVMKTRIDIAEDGSATGQVEIEMVGYPALAARGRFKALAPERRSRLVRDIMRSSYGVEADGQIEFDDPIPMRDRFHLKASFRIRKALNLPGSGALGTGPWFYNEFPISHWAQESLQTDEDLAYEASCGTGSSTEHYEYVLPASMQVLSVPQGRAFDSPLLRYESHYTLDGRTFKISRELLDRSPAPLCSPQAQRQLRDAGRDLLADLRQQLLYK